MRKNWKKYALGAAVGATAYGGSKLYGAMKNRPTETVKSPQMSIQPEKLSTLIPQEKTPTPTKSAPITTNQEEHGYKYPKPNQPPIKENLVKSKNRIPLPKTNYDDKSTLAEIPWSERKSLFGKVTSKQRA